MRTLRIILLTFAVLIMSVLAGAWIGPSMLDWGRYREVIATLASTALGRPVHIEGAVTLQLLPEPILTASRITVQDRPVPATNARDAASFSVARLRLRVALGPLLAGRVDARELVLDQPVLRLAWPLQQDSLPDRPSWLASLSARIEGGTLVLGGVSIGDVSASVTTDADGALMGAGEALLFGQSWRFTTRVGGRVAGGPRAIGLQATLDGQGRMRDSGGRFSGQIAADGGLEGQISGRGPDLSLLLPAPAVPWRAEGRLTAAGGLAAADELSLEIAGSPARGAVALRVAPMPRLDVALAASRLDLDAWLPVLLRGAPDGMETGIDLSAEAATLAGGTLRGLRSAFDFGPGGVVVRDASAILPGEAAFRLSGAVRSGPDAGQAGAPEPHAPFQGSVALSLPNLRTTLQWLRDARLGFSLAALPPEVLRAGQLAADMRLDRQSAVFSNVSGMIDGIRLTGQATLVRPGPVDRPRLDLALQLDRLPLDPWLLEPPPGTPSAGMSRLPGGLDATLHLRAARAEWHAIEADAVSLDAVVKAGAARVQRLEGTVQGIHAAVSGTVDAAGRVTDGELRLAAEHADALPGLWRRAAGEAMPLPAAVFDGPLTLTAQAAGPPEALSGRIEAELADAQLVAQPVVNLATGAWSATVTLRHPGAPRLLDTLGLDKSGGSAAWLGDGSLSLISQMSGAPGRLAADRFELTAGALRASGALKLVAGDGAGPLLSGRILADTLPLPSWRLADPLPFPALRGWRADLHLEAAQILGGGFSLLSQAAAEVMLDAGRLRVTHLAGKLAGGTVTADAQLDATAEPPRIAVQATLAGVSPPPELGGGRLDATADVTAEGYGAGAMLATLAGSARVSDSGGRLPGFDAAGVTASLAATAPEAVLSGVRAALAGGATGFDRLEAKLALSHGAASLREASLTSPAGTVALSGTITGAGDLAGAALDLAVALRPAIADPPRIGLRLIGPAGDPARLPDLTDLTRWLSARP